MPAASKHPAPAPQRLGEHAIVIGASIAGLLAARVLSDSYDRVTVLDRDALPDGLAGNRRAVPQGLHAHGLQPGGQRAVEQLLPGLREEALAAGGLPMRDGSDLRMRVGGHNLRRAGVEGEYAVASRPLLEGLIRRRVAAIDNVTIRDGVAVSGFVADAGRVTGVVAKDRGAAAPEHELSADLVVAATGRGGKVPAWLEAIGYERPVEERIGVDVLYASRQLRRPPGHLHDDRLVLNGATPDRPRCMALVAEEDGRWNLTLQGYGEENRPPTDDDGFRAFLATVSEPDVFAALERAEPLSPIYTYAFSASLRRRYDRLQRFPDGLLVMGDALCSFNPIYGQGMSVAALEAVALQGVLRKGDRRLARRFFKAAGRPVDHAWKMAAGPDMRMPEVQERPALPDRIIGRYMDRLLAVAAYDEDVARTFLEVMGMLAPPASILRPQIARRVLRRGATRSATPRPVLEPLPSSARA